MAARFRAWQAVESDHRLEETGLRLREGALWLGDAQLGEGSPAVLSLARTFSSHGLACVVGKEALPREGFSRFVELLSASPDGLSAQGGILGAWKKSEFAESLWLRRLTVASAPEPTQRDRGTGPGEEWGKGLSEGAELSSLADPLLLARLSALQKRGPKERRLLDLLVRLGPTEDISAFLT